MTERLYYHDSYLTQFRARVVARADGGLRVWLDRTAFYPESGGQPSDGGTLGGARVVDVVDEEDRIAHVLEQPVMEDEVEGRIDWARRFDHMQQHSGQHLLSSVFEELYAMKTVSFHLGAEASTIDLDAASLSAEQIAAAELRANELAQQNRAVSVSFEDASEASGLRKASEREGTLRIVTIEGLDRSACGGTHVRATGEIGPVLIRRTEKIRGNVRVEFLCGMRAVRRARADYDALSKIARLYSAAVDDTPELAASTLEQARDAEKTRRKLALELAERRGRELHAAAAEDAAGLRRHVERIKAGAIGDDTRALAQSFTSLPRAVFIAVSDSPPSILLAASKDSGIHAGNVLKERLAAAGGRGGGNAQLAQGSAPDAGALERALEELSRLLV
jgi:alanyl-tRNA synthetase